MKKQYVYLSKEKIKEVTRLLTKEELLKIIEATLLKSDLVDTLINTWEKKDGVTNDKIEKYINTKFIRKQE